MGAPFDPQLPSVIMMNGGPGGLSMEPYESLVEALPGYNVVHFQVRGAGCNTYPLDASYDRYLNTEFTAYDVEHLRQALGIEQWAAAFGVSYGTNTARMYGRLFPARVKLLVLDSVDGGNHEDINGYLPLFYTVFNKLAARFEKKSEHAIAPHHFLNMKRQIEEDFLQIAHYPDNSIFGWLYDEGIGKDMDLKRSRPYVLALLSLVYSGEVEGNLADLMGVMLFGELEPHLKAGLEAAHHQVLENTDRHFYSFLFSDYADLTKGKEFLSWRVSKAFDENEEDPLPLCSPVPIFALQGDLDVATPIDLTVKALSNQKCYSGGVTLAVFKGIGHSVVGETCGSALLRSVMSGSSPDQALTANAECKDQPIEFFKW